MSTTLPKDSNERKRRPLFRGPLRYFPAALAGVAEVCQIGNEKHNPGEELHHARGKSTDHADCILRHLLDLAEDFGKGAGRDENGVPQVLYIAWRALALAQEWLETNTAAPLAPGARLPIEQAPAVIIDEATDLDEAVETSFDQTFTPDDSRHGPRDRRVRQNHLRASIMRRRCGDGRRAEDGLSPYWHLPNEKRDGPYDRRDFNNTGEAYRMGFRRLRPLGRRAGDAK